MQDIFQVCVFCSGGGGNFRALVKNQLTYGYRINNLIVDRYCGAIEIARESNISYSLIEKDDPEIFCNRLDKSIPENTDLIVLAGFFPILNTKFCNKWSLRIINTHPSLLPKYGGLGMYGVRVQEAVLRNGDIYAGCTIHFVTDEIDSGEIIIQKKILIKSGETAWALGGRIFVEETKLLPLAISIIMEKRRKNV